jgi:tRNA threonylcarbamoyladenosine biosynthesis protein TsaB
LRILAIDTSGEYCSVALTREGGLDANEVHAGQRQSELVLGMIDEMLAAQGLRVADLDGIAFGAGPGSFTGLRIACGVTQGLAFAAGLPVAGIVTLLAMAEASGAARVISCLDARMHEIYHAAYERSSDGWQVVSAPGLYAPAEAPELAAGDWFGCGSGFAAYGDELARRYGSRLAGIDAAIRPRAREIAQLGLRQFEQGQGVDAAAAVPLYIRDKVALTMGER